MFLPALIVDKIAPLLLDQLTLHLMNKLQMNSDLESDPLAAQLSAFVDKWETGPLKTALEFLKIGELIEARNEFVRACVTNQYSAVARLCLGVLLYNEGQRQQGLINFKQAIEMNPFVCLPSLIQPAQVITHLGNQLLLPEGRHQAKTHFWSLHLQEPGVLQTVPPADDLLALGHWLPTQGKTHELLSSKIVKAGPILTVASSGKHAVVVWQLLEGLATTQVLSVFELATGTCLWSRRIPNKQLQFVSLSYVILASGSEHESYEFFASETGHSITTMEKTNYEITFCPDSKFLPDMQEYKRSNHTMRGKEDVYTEARYDYKAQAAKTSSSEKSPHSQQAYSKEYKDEYILADPFGLETNGIKITNTWEYKNSLSGYRSLSRRVDELHCNPKINNILLLKHA